jgi:hypothetical protein
MKIISRDVLEIRASACAFVFFLFITQKLSHNGRVYREIHRDMQPILVHFEKSTVEALKAERERTGCSVNEFIRRAVIAALEKKAEGKS